MRIHQKGTNSYRGFTIVELLIVIVVIAILAAITIVAYNGIQDRARASAAASSSSQAAKKIKVWQVDNEATTPTCAQFYSLITNATGSSCNFDYKDTNYQYTAGTAGVFCITTTVVNKSYKVSDSTTPAAGGCPGHGQGGVAAVTNLHPNPGGASTTGYSNYAGPAPNVSTMSSVSSTWSASGTAFRTTWTTGGSTSGDLGIYVNSNSALTAGKTYTHLYRISAGQASSITGPGIWAGSGVFSISASSAGTTTFSTNTPVTRWATFTADAAAMGAGLRIVQTPTIAAGYYYELSDVMLYEGTYNSSLGFNWGNSPNWAWNGTPNNSTSTGPPN